MAAGAGRLRRGVKWNFFESLEKACHGELGLNPCFGLRTFKASPKKISAVLTAHVERLGKPGDIVQVKPGHFRNHLLPSVLALPNVDRYRNPLKQYLKMFPDYVDRPEEKEEEKVEKAPAEDNSHLREAQAAAFRLDKGSIVFYRHVKEKDEIRQPVTAEIIVAEVARQLKVQITETNLRLPEPISVLGDVEVTLIFPPEVPLPNERKSISLKVRVRRK